jgi:hypothetical protein
MNQRIFVEADLYSSRDETSSKQKCYGIIPLDPDDIVDLEFVLILCGGISERSRLNSQETVPCPGRCWGFSDQLHCGLPGTIYCRPLSGCTMLRLHRHLL